MKCLSCEYARYTVHEGKVGCAYWSAIYHEESGNGSKSDVSKNFEMFNSGVEEAWTGWVYLKRAPDKKEATILGEGVMTNYCTIVNEDGCCSKFNEKRK